MAWWDIPSAEETEIRKAPHEDHVDSVISFDFQGAVHKEFIPEGKRLSVEFYKGITDRLLKHFQRIRPAAFCSREFLLLHDNAPALKAASFCQFLTQINVTTLYRPPVLSKCISARLFSVTQVENEVKRTSLCGCCWNPRSRNRWIKEGPKRRIFSIFPESVRPRQSLYIFWRFADRASQYFYLSN